MAANRLLILSFFLFSTGLPLRVFAQANTPLLERNISITAANEPLESLLSDIAKQGGFSFSYSPEIFDGKKRMNLRVKNKTVREVLEMVLTSGIRYKEKGGHVILTRAPDVQKSTLPSWYLVSGYVTDGEDGDKIPEVSVYDKQSRMSTITNKFGYYEIRVDRKITSLQLTVNKAQFKDTVIYVKQTGNTIQNVVIYPLPVEPDSAGPVAAATDHLEEDQMAFINFILSQEQKANTRNIRDTLYKKFQLTFLPFVGSNHRLSGNTINDYSLNVLAGYSMGTRKLEVAGLVNIDRDSVKSGQVAGLINAAGGPVTGVQVGGLINANRKQVRGVQLAGLINSNLDTLHGVQAAGLVNANLHSVNGFSVAGLLNTTLGKTKGFQAAGLLNFSLGNVDGLQVAGLMNICANDVTGSQATGLVNVSRKVSGSQVGFLNISDSCSGIPVGFLSFSRRGYHTIEISGDEIFPVNLSFRTGVRSFYNIFQAGMKLNDFDVPLWHFGYGIGTSARLKKNWYLNFDFTTQQIVKGSTFEESNLLSKFQLMVDKSFTRNFAIALGPVFNFFTTNTTDSHYSVFDKLPPYTFSDHTYSNDLNIKMWLGGKLALRFF